MLSPWRNILTILSKNCNVREESTALVIDYQIHWKNMFFAVAWEIRMLNNRGSMCNWAFRNSCLGRILNNQLKQLHFWNYTASWKTRGNYYIISQTYGTTRRKVFE